ncbi:hypothetical protein BUALT_Bualt11G0091500 [Buddleja alternifolia]|uniref:Myb/SANT-like domain-containing protein n=1 Tax=Buddleja alternifolia TaxID=168488 RepID=A0AAV6X1P0_9LAMI|nr:hypothetical protein BUALT_Bualt11G0091500 [Buddleja alternifolia]
MAASESFTTSCRGRKSVVSRRMWTRSEEDALIQALKKILTSGWKADNGFRVGYLNVLQDKIMKVFPTTDLRAQPHISSKMDAWKKQYNMLYVIVGASGVGQNSTTKMIETDSDKQWEAVYLTLDEKLVATNMIVKNTQVLAMFFSLPQEAKVGQMDGQFQDADGWLLEKEKFFIELLHATLGSNEISGGRLENNVLVGLQYRMNVEFGGFSETSVLNRFNMLRRRCKIFNVIFSDSDFKWNRARNWITTPKQK